MGVLNDKQFKFAQMAAGLILKAKELGYDVTLGDAYRDPRVFGPMGTRMGYGESQSAHKHRLAIDLNLFKGGKFLSATSDHAELGAWWESQGGVWGGRWNDGNHYSMEHNGIM